MFKKLKDKLAEEVKSSPQRIQQFAQAAQAAVTSASSSISDITNNDLFSIGDNDTVKTPTKPLPAQNRSDTFQEVSLTPQVALSVANVESSDHSPNDLIETQRQRRLSNSSFASDVSFKLPSYESPSMYHFQSDMEASASEAEDRGLASPGALSLERITKEQLYAAYRRTQQRYTKYRSQYADLARHYKLLERENAKARSVLVETQDKALRRISELREQCSLEQSAKAHLEHALREDIDERNIKIDSLTTKIKLLQINAGESEETTTDPNKSSDISPNDTQLIDISVASEIEPVSVEVSALNNKIEKMEQLIHKYKESLRTIKEKNSQLTTELQVVSIELENKTKQIEELNSTTSQLTEARQQIQDLKDMNEELQNKINTYDFTKTKEVSTLQIDYKKAEDEITQLKSKINTFSKREEEYAISLAENKLSIHKELESKESEINGLKDSLNECNKEVQSLRILVNDYVKNITLLEEEREKLNVEVIELKQIEKSATDKNSDFEELFIKYQTLEQTNSKLNEEFKCLELQAKQETAEKLAIIDRNSYLENRNKQISDENAKKSAQLTKLEGELKELRHAKENNDLIISETSKASVEIRLWKERYETLQTEIQDEREELEKLQSEIEKLLSNHDLIQVENTKLKENLTQLQAENLSKQEALITLRNMMRNNLKDVKKKANNLQQLAASLVDDVKPFKNINTEIKTYVNNFTDILKLLCHETELKDITKKYDDLKTEFNFIEEQCASLKQQYASIFVEVETIRTEKHKLLSKIHDLESEKELLVVENQRLSDSTEQYVKKLTDLNALDNENTTMALKVKDVEVECDKLRCELKQANSRYESDIQKLETEIKELTMKAREQEITHSTILEELAETKKERHALFTKIQNTAHNKTDAEKLQKNVNELIHENSTLKNNFESIASNFNTLENELAEVRRSHLEIEIEKDRLNSIIEIFEQSELMKSTRNSQETQTGEDFETLQCQLNNVLEENNILMTKCERVKQEKEDLYEKVLSLEQKNLEYEKAIENKQKTIDDITSLTEKLQCINEQLNHEIQNVKDTNVELSRKVTFSTDSVQKCEALETESDLLRDENRRLQSDIEGLQTYLTKISKENGTLNDKLRELIASSENTESHDTSVLQQDIEQLKNEIETEKEKYSDLLRQNNLLAEENLELKDQLQPQNYAHPGEMKAIELNANYDSSQTPSELATLKDRYKNMMKSKKEMEEKLSNSEHLNQAVNDNIKQLQESNHKLRTSNEKLERRLDEALVSLRHLHSLQENTELEYLRNILYEYLTGSGTHSETLAKVLAAVVKFDENQTQQVLQKEKERQGLLRQLGLL